ncbi:hypothetical protein [Streptomyces sp. TLI_171]|uniref:hypothetical protein n=1 Tax=Streptomyces sp. TLI_171 TaxID=1938859 RepID=UPI000C1A1BE2|nr:hypothetical protein [Streptomyces sp. TLI_171]RKE23493.1 hypothetical protein BX266_6965 [Streptomyces sp. TLI_171]
MNPNDTPAPSNPVPAAPERPLPTETPECEASTSHGISIPEPVELRTAWPSWIPLLVIGIVAASFLGFAVARILGWGS